MNVYGLSKRQAEKKVLEINAEALIIRSSSYFNPWHKEDGLCKILQSGRSSDQHFYLPSDIIVSPTYIPHLVNNVLDLLIDKEAGIWHLSSQEEISYSDFASLALGLAGLNQSIIRAVPSSNLQYTATRPLYSVLKSSWGMVLPMLTNTLQSFLDEFLKEPYVQMMPESSL